MARLVLGVVADDFTGASDAASFLVKEGVPTVLYSGIPRKKPVLEKNSAVVIALKTRTVSACEAVDESIAAFQWLRENGAEKLYLKYCSTFDSTEKGNIGPVVDAVMERWDLEATVLCPSLPVNGRTVRDGCLYVGGVLLEESHMKNHPLTPMRDSRIDRLMERQAAYKCEIIPLDELYQEDILSRLRENTREDVRYFVPDYYEDTHGDRIAEIFGDLAFLTGGSGLVGALGRRIVQRNQWHCQDTMTFMGTEGKALLLAGSCSKATLEQISDYIQKGYPAFKIQPEQLLSGELTKDMLWEKIREAGNRVLVYSSARPEERDESQQFGKELVAQMIEDVLSGLAKRAVDNGYTRIIVAGGETSGAVTKALGYHNFSIGVSVAPGVPVMMPLEDRKIRLVLKSGNFGQKDFFEEACRLTGRDAEC